MGRLVAWSAALIEESRLAARRLRRRPGFTLLAVVTLALGTGAALAVLTLADALFLRPLPVREPRTLVALYETRDGAGFHPLSLSAFLEYQRATRSFGALAAHYPYAPLSLDTGGEPQIVNGSVVSAAYFDLLGEPALRGRLFTPADDDPRTAERVALVSFDFWQRTLGGRADVVGRDLHLNGATFTIVGIAPREFVGVERGDPTSVWIPLGAARYGYRACEVAQPDCRWLTLLGRLAPSVSLAAAQAEVTTAARHLAREQGAADGVERGIAIVPLTGVHPAAREAATHLLRVLALAAALLVLVAAANVANLLLARAAERERELHLRIALGASRARLALATILDALLVALAGSGGALLVAASLAPVLATLYPTQVPLSLRPGAGEVAGALALACVLAAASALLPSARRGEEAGSLRAERGARLPRLLSYLVVAQVVLAFVLLVASGLLARGLAAANRTVGVPFESVATLRMRPRLLGLQASEALPLIREVERRSERLPGAQSVTVAEVLPPATGGSVEVARADGASATVTAARDAVGSGFFATFGLPIVAGRPLRDGDRAGAPSVAVVSRSLATALWPEASPIGRRIRVGGRALDVVGVVADAPHRELTGGPAREVYTSFWQEDDEADARLAVRTTGDAALLLTLLRRQALAADPRLPLEEVETLGDRWRRAVAPARVAALVAGWCCALAIVMSGAGLFGLLLLAVGRRERELGVRMAVGARPVDLGLLMIGGTARLVGVSLGLGLPVALAGSRLLAQYLYGVDGMDPAVIAGAAAVVAALATAAAWVPARQAWRTDVVRSLRRG